MSTTETAILQKIITSLAGQVVSDLYLRPGSQPVVRRDGELENLTSEAVVTADFLESSINFFLTAEQRQVLQHNKQLTIGYTFAGRLRLRVTVFYQQGFPEIAIHFVGSKIKTPAELGLPPQLEKLVTSERGLILLTGPYGSGRSATLASLVAAINRHQARHIVTVEAPIEYVFVPERSLIDQREIGRDVNTWEEAVLALPGQGGDVVVLAQLPNPAIVSQAIDLALAGKLVLAAAEADATIKTVERLVMSFKPDDQADVRLRLADALLAVFYQQLLPRIGGGRVLVSELLLGTPAVKTIIQEGKYYQLINLLQTSRSEGMIGFDYSLAQLVKTGEVMHDIALQYVHDKDLFNSLMRRS